MKGKGKRVRETGRDDHKGIILFTSCLFVYDRPSPLRSSFGLFSLRLESSRNGVSVGNECSEKRAVRSLSLTSSLCPAVPYSHNRSIVSLSTWQGSGSLPALTLRSRAECSEVKWPWVRRQDEKEIKGKIRRIPENTPHLVVTLHLPVMSAHPAPTGHPSPSMTVRNVSGVGNGGRLNRDKGRMGGTIWYASYFLFVSGACRHHIVPPPHYVRFLSLSFHSLRSFHSREEPNYVRIRKGMRERHGREAVRY